MKGRMSLSSLAHSGSAAAIPSPQAVIDTLGPARQETTIMAQLTQQEFSQAVALLAEELGLQRLRDRFVRLNGLVTRRRLASPQQLAGQLYILTAGLRRQVPATIAFHTIWTGQISEKVGEEGEKELEKIAEKINGCLGERDQIIPEKEAELDAALGEYMQRLSAVVGPERTRLDMLLKAVPAVADRLRATPPATAWDGGERGSEQTGTAREQG